jgi:CBS domain-containing protein
MKISDIMTKDVAKLDVSDTVQRAAELMKQHNIGSIPVCLGEKVVGIITDRDITLRSVAGNVNIQNQTVREVMTSNPVVGKPEMEAHEAVRLMSERQIRRLPIVENDNIVGMVSLGDLAVEPQLTDNAGIALESISEPSTPSV